VGGNLRRCLRRRQKLLPLQNITEFDRHCLLWFLRQPGNSMEEKAGARQRLMGLERHESHDTPENRVFQDFLRRSVEAASGYLQNFPGSHHREAVRGHGDRCQTLLREESIRSIPRLAAPPRPSYVLQYERNYHTIWTNYQDLVLHRRRRDDLLRWRHRLWRDAAAWALAVAIFHLENFRTIASDAVYVLQQQQEGRWTEFPSLILHGSWRLSPRPGEGNLSPRDRLRAWHGRRAELTLWNLHSDAMPLNFTPLRDLGADFLLEVAEGERRRRISIRCAYDWDPEGEDCPGAGEGPELPAGAWENPDSPVQGITLRPGRRAGVRDDALTLPVPLTPDSVERWHGNFAQTLEALLR
jgi:hypothetical protein